MGEIQRISRPEPSAGFFPKPYRVQGRDGRPGERRGTPERHKDAEDVLELSAEADGAPAVGPTTQDPSPPDSGLDLEA
ncbi:MAG: hypothetical protein SNJ74_07140 [Fimbriimonadaceae bacterium]